MTLLEVAADVWSAVGAELAIFVTTLACAVIVNKLFARGVNRKQPGKVVLHARKLPPSVPSRVKFDDSKQRLPSQKLKPWEIIDEIMSTMRDQTGTSAVRQVLALYSHFHDALQEEGKHIVEVAKCSSHTALAMYNTVMHCAMRAGQFKLVEAILEDMDKQGVRRSLHFYESAMKQLAGKKQYRLALNMYDHLIKDGLQPSVVTCSCSISFAVQLGETDRALEFFNKLSLITTPSIRAYMTVMRVHAKNQNWCSALETLRDMQRRNVKVDSLSLNVVLATGIASDQVEEMEKLLGEVEGMIPPIIDVVSYNTMVKGYAQRGDVDGAFSAIDRLRQRGLTPNAITFNTAIDAAVRASRHTEAWALVQDMENSGIRPDKFTCSILAKGLSKKITPQHIRCLLNLIKSIGPNCDSSLRASLYVGVLEGAAQIKDHEVFADAYALLSTEEEVVLSEGTQRRLREFVFHLAS